MLARMEAAASDITALLVAIIDASSRAARSHNQGSALSDVTALAAAATVAANAGVQDGDAFRATDLMHLLRRFG